MAGLGCGGVAAAPPFALAMAAAAWLNSSAFSACGLNDVPATPTPLDVPALIRCPALNRCAATAWARVGPLPATAPTGNAGLSWGSVVEGVDIRTAAIGPPLGASGTGFDAPDVGTGFPGDGAGTVVDETPPEGLANVEVDSRTTALTVDDCTDALMLSDPAGAPSIAPLIDVGTRTPCAVTATGCGSLIVAIFATFCPASSPCICLFCSSLSFIAASSTLLDTLRALIPYSAFVSLTMVVAS